MTGWTIILTCAYGAATLTKEKSGSNIYPMPVKHDYTNTIIEQQIFNL
jgi:hypothetical protein